jgi:hypothetical protein
MRQFLALLILSSLLTLQGAILVFADEAAPTEDPLMSEDEFNESFEEGNDTTEVLGTDDQMANAIEAPLICPFGLKLEAGANNAEEMATRYEDFYGLFNASYESTLGNAECGAPNETTDYLEKGDCTKNGLLVTEITEVIASDVVLDDQNKVLTVYAGLCCLAGVVNGSEVVSCDDVRTLYSLSYDECAAHAVNCEKRQWVIGDSGMGLIKLMVKQIFTFAALSVGSIFMGTIVFQGIKISVSGVTGDISEAKNKILQAIGGMVLLFLSGLLLYSINPGFFG